MRKRDYLTMLFIVLCLGFITYFSIKEIEKSREMNTGIRIQLNSIILQLDEIKTILQSDCQEVTVSAYHPKSRGINSDKDWKHTALMKKPIAGYTCAISDELFKLGWLGKKIYIDGIGVFKVRKAMDRMDKSVKGKQIDICAPSLKYAKNFGIKRNVIAVVLN